MQSYTAHFVAPKPYVPLRHILSPGVKLCMEATKCAANVETICRWRQIVQGRYKCAVTRWPMARLYDHFCLMIRCSDGPKSYWGYYQDYLVQIYGKKIIKKITSIFSKTAWPRPCTAKIDQNGDGGQCLNFILKLNVHVQYNMLKPIWPTPIALTCLKTERANLLK